MTTFSGEHVIPRSARAAAHQAEAAVTVRVFAQTDVGRTREHNEDSHVVALLSRTEPLRFAGVVEQPADPLATLFMVADGMGGAAAGEVASATAVDVVLRHLRERLSDRIKNDPRELVAAMTHAADVANWSIFQQAASRPDLRGMGTTATIVVLLGDTIYLAQVGDSRAYLIRGGVATQLTKDQSLMQKLIEAGELTEEEAALNERRNIILQALGPEQSVKVDITQQPLRRGDVLLLCSDGLSGLVKKEEMADAVGEEPDLPSACERLIELANDRGGPDNITVLIAAFDGPGLSEGRPGDEVRYRTVQADGETDTSGPAAGEPTSITQPWPVPKVDDRRRQRGTLYARVIAGLGVILVIWAALRLLMR